jgi:hypothetical protein
MGYAAINAHGKIHGVASDSTITLLCGQNKRWELAKLMSSVEMEHNWILEAHEPSTISVASLGLLCQGQ